MPPQNQISTNAGSLKGGNYWQNFLPKQEFTLGNQQSFLPQQKNTLDQQYAGGQPLSSTMSKYMPPIVMKPGSTDFSSSAPDTSAATYRASYAKKPEDLSFWEIMEKGVDYKKIATSGGEEGSFKLPFRKLFGFGPKGSYVKGSWDVSGEAPQEHKAKATISVPLSFG